MFLEDAFDLAHPPGPYQFPRQKVVMHPDKHANGRELNVQLRYTILYVDEVQASLAFYERAFGIERGFLHESGHYGELATGPTKLAFSSRKLMRDLGKHPARADPDAPVFEIAFETDDVASALERASAAGAIVRQDTRDEPWGQATAYVSDPDGNLVELCTPIKPSA